MENKSNVRQLRVAEEMGTLTPAVASRLDAVLKRTDNEHNVKDANYVKGLRESMLKQVKERAMSACATTWVSSTIGNACCSVATPGARARAHAPGDARRLRSDEATQKGATTLRRLGAPIECASGVRRECARGIFFFCFPIPFG